MYLVFVIITTNLLYSANAIEIVEHSSKVIIGISVFSAIYVSVILFEIVYYKKGRFEKYDFFYLNRSATDMLISTLEPYQGKYELKYAASDAVMSIKFKNLPHDDVLEIIERIEKTDGLFKSYSRKKSLYMSIFYGLLIITSIILFTILYIYPGDYLFQ